MTTPNQPSQTSGFYTKVWGAKRIHSKFWNVLHTVGNPIGLCWKINKLRHKLGVYPRFSENRCMYCGENCNYKK